MDQRPSDPVQVRRSRRGDAWVKKADIRRILAEVDRLEAVDEAEPVRIPGMMPRASVADQVRMAHWLNTGFTLRDPR